ncbi:hypothetical protein ADMFC3_22800 [Geovibrio sp. ADMFC3]
MDKENQVDSINETSIILSRSTELSSFEKNMLDPNDVSVTIRNGKRTVEGYDLNGNKVVMTTYLSNNAAAENKGLYSQTMSVCAGLSKEERVQEAKRLKKEEKLSQVEIAKKLDVSQKTISNDLKS